MTEYEDAHKETLLELDHNNHQRAFEKYLSGDRHAVDKARFLREWLQPQPHDYIVEFGSSSGKTCVDLARVSCCRTLGIDFDPEAVSTSTKMRDKHFPELAERVHFREDDVTVLDFPDGCTKILMPDFTEHIPDRVFDRLLTNIREKAGGIPVYIYTPDRGHLFEILKHRGWILKNTSGHINVKTSRELSDFLEARGFAILEKQWRPSHLPGWRAIEKVAGNIPAAGRLFRRRVAITAQARD